MGVWCRGAQHLSEALCSTSQSMMFAASACLLSTVGAVTSFCPTKPLSQTEG